MDTWIISCVFICSAQFSLKLVDSNITRRALDMVLIDAKYSSAAKYRQTRCPPCVSQINWNCIFCAYATTEMTCDWCVALMCARLNRLHSPFLGCQSTSIEIYPSCWMHGNERRVKCIHDGRDKCFQGIKRLLVLWRWCLTQAPMHSGTIKSRRRRIRHIKHHTFCTYTCA